MKNDFTLDTERFHRQGFPEAVYSYGKTEKQIIDIVKKMIKNPTPIIITKIEKIAATKIKKKFQVAKYHEKAKMIVINPLKKTGKNYIAGNTR